MGQKVIVPKSFKCRVIFQDLVVHTLFVEMIDIKTKGT